MLNERNSTRTNQGPGSSSSGYRRNKGIVATTRSGQRVRFVSMKGIKSKVELSFSRTQLIALVRHFISGSRNPRGCIDVLTCSLLTDVPTTWRVRFIMNGSLWVRLTPFPRIPAGISFDESGPRYLCLVAGFRKLSHQCLHLSHPRVNVIRLAVPSRKTWITSYPSLSRRSPTKDEPPSFPLIGTTRLRLSLCEAHGPPIFLRLASCNLVAITFVNLGVYNCRLQEVGSSLFPFVPSGCQSDSVPPLEGPEERHNPRFYKEFQPRMGLLVFL